MTFEDFKAQWENGLEYVEAHTSGSTGMPKLVRLPKSDMRQSARQTNQFFGINSRSLLALPLSLDYIAGKMMAVRAIEAGCELQMIEPANRFDWAGECDLMSVVPSQVPWLLYNKEWAKKIENVIIGGAAIADKLKRQLQEAGYSAYCSYGMTETCSHVALSRVREIDTPYQAMPGVSFAVDSRGRLVIEAAKFTFGRLYTNDVVDLIDSKHFYWRGRYDNVINSGGLKIHPEEVERKLASHIASDFYVIGVPDDFWGEVVGLVMERSTQSAPELMSELRQTLDHRHLPKKIWVVERLARASHGKIKRILPDEPPICTYESIS